MAPTVCQYSFASLNLPLFPSRALPPTKFHFYSFLPSKSCFNSAAMGSKHAYWSSVEADIQTQLRQSLPTSSPPVLAKSIQQLLSAVPIAPAPLLCIAACELVGGCQKHAMDTACALQLMHAVVYLGDRRTRGSPTAIEILMPDAISPLCYELAAKPVGNVDPGRRVRVVAEMATALFPQGLGEAEMKKSLAGCGAACGAILGGGDEAPVERTRKVGMYVGLIYGLLCSERGNSGRLEAAKKYKYMALEELKGFVGSKNKHLMSGLIQFYCCKLG